MRNFKMTSETSLRQCVQRKNRWRDRDEASSLALCHGTANRSRWLGLGSANQINKWGLIRPS